VHAASASSRSSSARSASSPPPPAAAAAASLTPPLSPGPRAPHIPAAELLLLWALGRNTDSPVFQVRGPGSGVGSQVALASRPQALRMPAAALVLYILFVGGRKAAGAKRASGARDPVAGAARRRGRAAGERGNARARKASMRLGIPPEVTRRQRQAFTLGKRQDNNLC
jgi:hypothetical protein